MDRRTGRPLMAYLSVCCTLAVAGLALSSSIDEQSLPHAEQQWRERGSDAAKMSHGVQILLESPAKPAYASAAVGKTKGKAHEIGFKSTISKRDFAAGWKGEHRAFTMNSKERSLKHTAKHAAGAEGKSAAYEIGFKQGYNKQAPPKWEFKPPIPKPSGRAWKPVSGNPDDNDDSDDDADDEDEDDDNDDDDDNEATQHTGFRRAWAKSDAVLKKAERAHVSSPGMKVKADRVNEELNNKKEIGAKASQQRRAAAFKAAWAKSNHEMQKASKEQVKGQPHHVAKPAPKAWFHHKPAVVHHTTAAHKRELAKMKKFKAEWSKSNRIMRVAKTEQRAGVAMTGHGRQGKGKGKRWSKIVKQHIVKKAAKSVEVARKKTVAQEAVVKSKRKHEVRIKQGDINASRSAAQAKTRSRLRREVAQAVRQASKVHLTGCRDMPRYALKCHTFVKWLTCHNKPVRTVCPKMCSACPKHLKSACVNRNPARCKELVPGKGKGKPRSTRCQEPGIAAMCARTCHLCGARETKPAWHRMHKKHAWNPWSSSSKTSAKSKHAKVATHKAEHCHDAAGDKCIVLTEASYHAKKSKAMIQMESVHDDDDAWVEMIGSQSMLTANAPNKIGHREPKVFQRDHKKRRAWATSHRHLVHAGKGKGKGSHGAQVNQVPVVHHRSGCHKPSVAKVCRKTCKLCVPCVDRSLNCKAQIKDNGCGRIKVKRLCRKSCQLCTVMPTRTHIEVKTKARAKSAAAAVKAMHTENKDIRKMASGTQEMIHKEVASKRAASKRAAQAEKAKQKAKQAHAESKLGAETKIKLRARKEEIATAKKKWAKQQHDANKEARRKKAARVGMTNTQRQERRTKSMLKGSHAASTARKESLFKRLKRGAKMAKARKTAAVQKLEKLKECGCVNVAGDKCEQMTSNGKCSVEAVAQQCLRSCCEKCQFGRKSQFCGSKRCDRCDVTKCARARVGKGKGI